MTKYDVYYYGAGKLRKIIRSCQKQNHIQQVSFSTYHDCLTQVCFDCKVIRTSIKDVAGKE